MTYIVPNSGIGLDSTIARAWPNGSRPTSISEYYRGGLYVPNGHVLSQDIPSSGQIKFSDFRGTGHETPNHIILESFWNNRNRLYQLAGNPHGANSIYPGDLLRSNGHPNRYQTAVLGKTYYSLGDIPLYSEYTTLVVIGMIADGGLSYGTINDVSLNPYYESVWAGLSASCYHIKLPISSVTSSTYSAPRLSLNFGVWMLSYLIPGRWTVRYTQEMQNSNDVNIGNDYLYILQGGEFAVISARDMGDDSALGYPEGTAPQYSGPGTTLGFNMWWYTSGLAVSSFNTQATTSSVTWQNVFGDGVRNGWWGTTYKRLFIFSRVS